METIHKLKDNSYKKILAKPEMFLEFLHSFIPIDMLKHIKPSDIEDISERFLPLFSDNKDSDTVKRIRLSEDEPLYIISIIEHESSVNFSACFKLLQYITYVLSDYVKENDKKHEDELKATGCTNLILSTDKDFKLPPVLPIIFYDGAKKWTSSLNLVDRTEFSDIFYKYIPKFQYELVDLNQYSCDDLVSFGGLLSLILIIDKVRKPEDLEMLNTLPKDYLEKVTLNVPKHLLELLADCIGLFLRKVEVEEEKINAITEKIYQRRSVEMFDVQFTINDIKREGAKESAIEIAKNALREGATAEFVKKITGLAIEIIQRLQKELEEEYIS